MRYFKTLILFLSIPVYSFAQTYFEKASTVGAYDFSSPSQFEFKRLGTSSGHTDAPPGSYPYGYILEMYHLSNYGLQMYIPENQGTMYFRTGWNDLGTWRELLTSDSYTTILDQSYVPKTGGVFSGPLEVDNAVYTRYGNSFTQVTSMLAGSTFGTLIQSNENGHMVLGLRDNDIGDSFTIISGGGDYMSNNTYDRIVLSAKADGRVFIPNGNLSINGEVESNRIKVHTNSGNVPDYVFSKDYKLKTLEEIEDFIVENSHLPNIPNAEEIGTNGQDVGELQLKLLEKIEELMLYTIQQQKEIELLKKELKAIKKSNEN